MTKGQFSRRGFLAAAAAGAALAWLQAHAAEVRAAGALAAGSGDEWLSLTAEQAAVLDAVTAQIIPNDDTAGAREAKVVRFLDQAFAGVMKADRTDLLKALEALQQTTRAHSPAAANFAALIDADQIAVLQALEKSDKDAFGSLRSLTMLGMFANPSYGGNFEKSGWKLLGFVDQFAWQPPFGYYDRV